MGGKAGAALLENGLEVEENREDLSCMIRTQGMLGRWEQGSQVASGHLQVIHKQAPVQGVLLYLRSFAGQRLWAGQ